MKYIKSYKLFENIDIVKSIEIEFEHNTGIEFSDIETTYRKGAISLIMDEVFTDASIKKLFDEYFISKEASTLADSGDDAAERFNLRAECKSAFDRLYNTIVEVNNQLFSRIAKKYDLLNMKFTVSILLAHKYKSTACVEWELPT